MEAPTPNSESSLEHEKIKTQLLATAKSDQDARSTRSKEIIEQVDKANQEQLQSIIEVHGWPSPSRFGEEAANAAWLIAQHADANPVFQRKCLELMQAEKAVSQEDLGYLADRVRVNEGRPQLFGTQWIVENDEFKPQPIEDEENLDKRREKIGMPPFDEYVKVMQKQFIEWKKSQESNE